MADKTYKLLGGALSLEVFEVDSVDGGWAWNVFGHENGCAFLSSEREFPRRTDAATDGRAKALEWVRRQLDKEMGRGK